MLSNDYTHNFTVEEICRVREEAGEAREAGPEEEGQVNAGYEQQLWWPPQTQLFISEQ